MPNAISKDLKDQIMSRVRESGISVVEIARQHGIKVNTVYNWISKSLHGNNGSTLRESRLRRENLQLKQLLGQLTLDLERGKKNHYG